MLEGRYRDKKYLTKYDLSLELFYKFNLKVKDVYPIRDVYILSTDKGDKILKKVDYLLEELEFINSAVEYIKKSFNRVLEFTYDTDGKVYTEWKNNLYCVMDLVPGRECDFSNPIDLSIAAKGLGELHKASVGFRTNYTSRYTAGKTINSFKRKIDELMLFNSIANMHECKTEFDKIFLDNLDFHIEEAKKSIKLLEASAFYDLCKEEDNIVLCHNDLAYHNILINDEEAYFIDFDYAVIDLKVNDLCNFINKAIKNFAFDMEKAEGILKDYCTKNSLDKSEVKVLYGLLYFPDDFYSISRDYYTRRKDWEEEVFLDRLIKKVSYKEDRSEFLEEFESKIIDKF